MKIGVATMLLTGALTLPCLAADKPDASFSYKDWELACDNTGTCRAAGYQAEGVEPAVSMLLVRSAGPRQALTAQVQLGSYGEADSALAKGVKSLAIKVDDRTIGKVDIDPATQTGSLSAPALATVLPALLHASAVTWTSGKQAWELSTAGASAVLLKMDEVQGRIGTVGAIVRKGTRPEDGVARPVPIPVVIAAPVPKADKHDVLLPPPQRAALLEELRHRVSRDDCPGLYEATNGEQAIDLALHRLSGEHLIASATCETYAYNESVRFWVINARSPFAPVAAGDSANDYSDGTISAAQKGRGLGDCWYSAEWTWNGAQFVPTRRATTGMCKSIAAGGAWNLPTYITTVRKSAGTAH